MLTTIIVNLTVYGYGHLFLKVCKMYRSSKILVCAPQNDAADLVAERLLDHVDAKSIGRFNAASRYANSMSDKVS